MEEKKKYKVLLIGTSSPHVANHLNRISNDIFEIEIISNGKTFFPDQNKVTLVDFSMVRFWNFIITPYKIRQRIKIFSPDVVHVHQANSVALYTLLANKRAKKPVVLTAWGSDILINPDKNWFFNRMVKFILKRVKVCTSDSVFMAKKMQDLVPEYLLNIEICNFGVPETEIPVIKENIIYSNRSHNPLYRIDEVIKAFDRFVESKPMGDWKLIVAGSGSETEDLKKLTVELEIQNKVEFIGFVNAQTNSENYAKAKFYISLPESDATAMSLLEAMYYKCVPVLIDLPANREWVEDEINGIIVHDLNENFLQRAIELNTEAIGNMNRKIINEKGTVSISRIKFKEVLLRAIAK